MMEIPTITFPFSRTPTVKVSKILKWPSRAHVKTLIILNQVALYFQVFFSFLCRNLLLYKTFLLVFVVAPPPPAAVFVSPKAVRKAVKGALLGALIERRLERLEDYRNRNVDISFTLNKPGSCWTVIGMKKNTIDE